MDASNRIEELVERFEDQHDDYTSGTYNETQLRREFLDPLFESLGWDVSNKTGRSELYKEVIHEDRVKTTEGSKFFKAPDYAFRIGGTRKFFVEAKKPSVKIEKQLDPAFQLRCYAWSAKLPLSILTDFEEFAIYDCRVRPDKGDKPKVALLDYFVYKDYPKKWHQIANIFSHEAVQNGSFDTFAEGLKVKKGTVQVDNAFLVEIERWRELLAQNIAERNSNVSTRALNYAVQMTIDRIIFLRICEDRGIEHYEQLQEISKGVDVYQNLCTLFQHADARYNSGLFHFNKEKDQSSPADSLTLGLEIDDQVLRDILNNLYLPQSPYVFKVIPSDILGQVYERFLGKVIHLTPDHKANVEEKPEVRKAGGVYYTPTHIVDYIVRNTLEPLIANKTPKEVALLKVLDPACGSGSFLLGAYQYLLDWHLHWYTSTEPQKWTKGKNPAVCEIIGGWQLTTSKKKEILLNNIFGVDIDAQAVEMTKLSLLLKVLEGETHETISSQLSLWHERVLPDLGKNIQCGNSLIGPDYYENMQFSMEFIDDDERYRVNAFDWERTFPNVFREGGFDAVIGNPPYVDIIGIPPEQRKYFQKRYDTFLYRSDILNVFFHKAVEIIRENGSLGYITSNTYFSSESANKLRAMMGKTLRIKQIVDLGGWVFSQANVDTAILIGQRREPQQTDNVFLAVCQSLLDFKQIVSGTAVFSYNQVQLDFARSDGASWQISSGAATDKVVKRIAALPQLLDSCVEFSRGYIAYDAHRGHSQQMIDDRVFHAATKETQKYKKELLGSDIGRYCFNVKSKLWINFGGNLAAPRDKRFHAGERIWIQRIRNPKLKQRMVCFYTDKHEEYAASSGLTIVRKIGGDWDLKAICGILNSRFVNWWFRQLFHDVNIKPTDMAKIPLPNLNFSKSTDKACHNKLVSLVERILKLNEQTIRTPHEEEIVSREVQAVDRSIDRLVYELYGLTEDELRLIET